VVDSGTRILNDPVALTLLGPQAEDRIRDASEELMSPEVKALRAHIVLRSRYTEDRLQLSISRGISQYIILGAGFDTFALRQPTWASALSIIELDHPETQKTKQLRIQEAGILLPSNVTLVGVDFERESIADALRRAGVDHSRPVFFSWLGVTMYLTPSAIASTLRSMAASSAGSEAVLTFLEEPDSSSSTSRTLAERVAEAGEPFLSYFTPESVKETLLNAGFSQALLLSVDESACYFDEAEGSLTNPRRPCIISAIV